VISDLFSQGGERRIKSKMEWTPLDIFLTKCWCSKYT